MAIQNLGYRPIYKLDTPADMKLLNDTLKALWIKLMGNLTSRDMTQDAQQAVKDAFGTTLSGMDSHIDSIDQLNAAQNGRLKVLEDYKAADTEAMTALTGRVTALEQALTALTGRVETLEQTQTGGKA